jgi:hypothetical protein
MMHYVNLGIHKRNKQIPFDMPTAIWVGMERRSDWAMKGLATKESKEGWRIVLSFTDVLSRRPL